MNAADQSPTRPRARVRIGRPRPGRGRLCWWECPHCTRRGPGIPVHLLTFVTGRAASHMRRHHGYQPIPDFTPPGARRALPVVEVRVSCDSGGTVETLLAAARAAEFTARAAAVQTVSARGEQGPGRTAA